MGDDCDRLDLPLVSSGKVREVYDLGEDRLLVVASDRVSTYDVVHPTPVRGKGAVLTGISAFWFARTSGVVANHMLATTDGVPDAVRGRAMVVRRLEMLPVECVVRGHLAGSGWTDYRRTGAISGVALPAGLRESEELPAPIFTPTTKAAEGHDAPIDLAGAARLVAPLAAEGDGDALIEQVRDVCVRLYEAGRDHAARRGVILADTKFELGLDLRDPDRPELVLADEALTPDSSRYWPADGFAVGRAQPSFDKQYVRDWAAASGWDKTPPAPPIPEDVLRGTRERYAEAYARICDEPLEAWLRRTAP